MSDEDLRQSAAAKISAENARVDAEIEKINGKRLDRRVGGYFAAGIDIMRGQGWKSGEVGQVLNIIMDAIYNASAHICLTEEEVRAYDEARIAAERRGHRPQRG